MATNGGAHKFDKNENNWLHKHFEPQQVDVVVSSIYILALDSLECICRDSSFKYVALDNVSRILDGQVWSVKGWVDSVRLLSYLLGAGAA